MRRVVVLLSVLAGLALALPAAAPAATYAVDGTRMIAGGGRFVEIPGFPGRYIDRRLLPDIAWIADHFHIEVNDGYSLSRVHTRTGEHPRGLALDIVPGEGATWADITRLARWAEPHQNQPRAPFKWVGYAGDVGHGPPGHCRRPSPRSTCFPHLHLSWMHGETPVAVPAPWVMTLRIRRLTAG